MINQVQINRTLFTTTVETPEGRIIVVQDSVIDRLTKAGWQLVSRTKKPSMTVVVYRRPGGINLHGRQKQEKKG